MLQPIVRCARPIGASPRAAFRKRNACWRDGQATFAGSGRHWLSTATVTQETSHPLSPRVLVLDDWEGRLAESAGVAKMRQAGASVAVLGGGRTISDLNDSELADVTAVMTVRERTKIDNAFLDRLPALQLILQTGGHAYHADVDALRRRGVRLALGRHVKMPLRAVPELVFGLMIGAMRHVGRAQHALAAGSWPVLTGRTLHGKTLGLLGLGRHGEHIGRLAQAFGMRVIAWDRSAHDMDGTAAVVDLQNSVIQVEKAFVASEVPRVGLTTLLNHADVVSVHLRLSEESRGLLSSDRLAEMKDGAVLVNTARGAIIDEAAMAKALQDPDAPLSAAGLDVFAHEPLPKDSPLRGAPNVVLTPHVGWTVEEVFDEFADIAATQLIQFGTGTLSDDELLV